MHVNYYLDNDGDLIPLCEDCAGRRPMEYRDGPGLACDHCGYEEPHPDPPANKGPTWGDQQHGIDGY